MGQKVNPHGLRVGVIKDWDSRWYAHLRSATFALYAFFVRDESSLEIAPSATARIVNPFPAFVLLLIAPITLLISYGISGSRIMSAPPAIPAYNVSPVGHPVPQPHSPPTGFKQHLHYEYYQT